MRRYYKAGVEETGCESVDWIQLAQYKVQRRALVNKVVNVRFQVLTAASMKMTSVGYNAV
jgi:hypothetical protein